MIVSADCVRQHHAGAGKAKHDNKRILAFFDKGFDGDRISSGQPAAAGFKSCPKTYLFYFSDKRHNFPADKSGEKRFSHPCVPAGGNKDGKFYYGVVHERGNHWN